MVIVAILAVISFPKFTAMRENSFDQEAIANLKLIQDTEKYRKMEMGSYVSCSDAATINTELRLFIPTTSPNWEYKVDGVDTDTFTGKARRLGSDSRVKCIDQDDDEPSSCASY